MPGLRRLLLQTLIALVLVLPGTALAQATVTLVMNDDQAAEAGPDTASFTVTRTGSTAQALAVRLGGSGTATWGSDFTGSGNGFFAITGTSFQVTIPAGQASTPVTITPQQDNTIEGQENFTFSVTPDAAYVVGSPSQDSLTIDDDVAEVTLEMTDPEATEAGPTTATLVVSRTNNGRVASALAVRLSGSGTATWGSDFTGSGNGFFAITGTSFQVTIPANQLSVTVTITPQQDPIDDGEEDETFTFTLAAPGDANSAYTIGTPDSDTFIIRNFSPVIFKDGLETPSPVPD